PGLRCRRAPGAGPGRRDGAHAGSRDRRAAHTTSRAIRRAPARGAGGGDRLGALPRALQPGLRRAAGRLQRRRRVCPAGAVSYNLSMRRTRIPGMLALALAMIGATASAGETPADPLAGITVRRDVTYATPPTGALALDVYRPADARAPSPVLLFFHGGGWIMGSKLDAVPEAVPAPTY